MEVFAEVHAEIPLLSSPRFYSAGCFISTKTRNIMDFFIGLIIVALVSYYVARWFLGGGK